MTLKRKSKPVEDLAIGLFGTDHNHLKTRSELMDAWRILPGFDKEKYRKAARERLI
jgi:hypothetical protein